MGEVTRIMSTSAEERMGYQVKFQIAITTRDIAFNNMAGNSVTLSLDENTSLSDNIMMIRNALNFPIHETVRFLSDNGLADPNQLVGSKTFPCNIGIITTSLIAGSMGDTKQNFIQAFNIGEDFLKRIPDSTMEEIWQRSERACVGWMFILGGIQTRQFDEDILNCRITSTDEFYENFHKSHSEELAKFVTRIPIANFKNTFHRYPEFRWIVSAMIESNFPAYKIFKEWINDPDATQGVWKDLVCDKYGSRVVESFVVHLHLSTSLVETLCSSETMIHFYGNHVVAACYNIISYSPEYKHISDRIKQEINIKMFSQKLCRRKQSWTPTKLFEYIAVGDDPNFVWRFFESHPSLIHPYWCDLLGLLAPRDREMRKFLAREEAAYHRLRLEEAGIDIEAILKLK